MPALFGALASNRSACIQFFAVDPARRQGLSRPLRYFDGPLSPLPIAVRKPESESAPRLLLNLCALAGECRLVAGERLGRRPPVRSLGVKICWGTPGSATTVAARQSSHGAASESTALLNSDTRCDKGAAGSLAGAAPGAFQGWATGRVRPTLDHLCRLAYKLKLPLIHLFQGVPAEWRGPDDLGCETCRQGMRQSQPRIDRGELRRVLMTVLSENPAPEVGRRLKFRRTQTLFPREPGLCRQIALRRESGVHPSTNRQLYTDPSVDSSKPFCADT